MSKKKSKGILTKAFAVASIAYILAVGIRVGPTNNFNQVAKKTGSVLVNDAATVGVATVGGVLAIGALPSLLWGLCINAMPKNY